MPVHWEAQAEPIPGYRLIERLGRGGFGEVWKAEAPGGFYKAVKFVYGDISSIEEGGGSLAEQELRSLARVREVRHPFVLSMERYEVVNDQLVIVMELADRDLNDRMKECQREGLPGIPRDELLKYMREAAEALDLMNAQHDLQHLDIKPQNLFLVGSHLKIADFGLVKDLEERTTVITGGVTPVYACPESFDGWVSRHSDQYSLAIVYQEMLTGLRPFPGPSARQFMLQHLTGEPDLSRLPACDRLIVAKGLAKDPNDRFASCTDFIEQLQNVDVDSDMDTVLVASSTGSAPAEECDLSTRLQEKRSDEQARARLSILDEATLETSPQGVLCPTLVIGLGKTGIRCMERLRAKVTARYGAPHAWPPLRLLGVDVDPNVLRDINKTEPVSRAARDQLLLCHMKKPNLYFKKWEELKHISSWLDPNVLFQMSSNGGTSGYRGLGRLALIDNIDRVASRLRAELETLLDPVRIKNATTATGLRLRRRRPRVYVVTSMGGGVGSGALIDLCYQVKQALLEKGDGLADVQAVLLAGVAQEERSADLRKINHYALGQDLLELSRPDAQFAARYQDEGEPVRFTGPPVKTTYVFDASATTLPEPRHEAMLDTASEFLIESTTASFGREMDGMEAEERWPMFRSVGWFCLNYPYSTLVRQVATELCEKTVGVWTSKLKLEAAQRITKAAEGTVSTAGFEPSAVARRLLDASNEHMPEPVHVLTDRIIADLEQRLRSSKSDEGMRFIHKVLKTLRALLGPDPNEDGNDLAEEPALIRAVIEGTNEVANQLYEPLERAVAAALDQAGNRLDRARCSWDGFGTYLLHMIDQQQNQAREDHRLLSGRCKEMHQKIEHWLDHQSAWPSRYSTLIKAVREYVNAKIEFRLREHVVQAYLVLRGRLSDMSRKLVQVRQEVERLHERLVEETKRATADGGFCTQALYPGGFVNLEDAAQQLVTNLEPMVRQLDGHLQRSALMSQGGLWNACVAKRSASDDLMNQLISSAGHWVQEQLPPTDAADCFYDRHSEDASAVSRELEVFYEWATPTVPFRESTRSTAQPVLRSLCIAPYSGTGEAFLKQVTQTIGDQTLHTTRDGNRCIFSRMVCHGSLGQVLPEWLLKSKSLYASAVTTRFSPEIFPRGDG